MQNNFAQEGILKTVLDKDSVITFRSFDASVNKIDALKSKEIIKNIVYANNNDELTLQNSLSDTSGFTHEFYLQYYKGIRVENAMYIAHVKNLKIKLL
jgi:Zn-dependent metalloprotease